VAARAKTSQPFGDWLQNSWTTEASSKGIEHWALVGELVKNLGQAEVAAVEASCAARLVVGIAKWCSLRESCAAGEIAAILKNPVSVFAPSSKLPWAVCWKSPTEYRLPPQIDRYIDHGTRLVAFLTPPAKGDQRQRVIAMIRWMFDVVATIAGDENRQVSRIHDVIKSIIDKDYVNALTGSLSVAAQIGNYDMPVPAIRALQLVGAVASYARTYDETKGLDAAAARDARRHALEALIDAATERRARARNAVWSLGSNVGMSLTYTTKVDRLVEADDATHEIAVRVPLGLAVQYLPSDLERPGWTSWVRYCGVHAGVQLADLGQFARETANQVTWASFVSPGVELGFLVGEPHRTVSVTAHVSYAPAIADGTPPVWRYGISIGYYVPFFDLN
ncbi:MAG TPA: hypothetical protein VK607_05620, partial [Kofleriaceae bacterium]|nr:hypothetical protein [Kofleriaceae bacterium]